MLLEEEFPPSRLQTVSEAISGLLQHHMGGKTRLSHALLQSHREVLADWEENKIFQILTALVSCKPQSQLNLPVPTFLPPATLNISREEILYH